MCTYGTANGHGVWMMVNRKDIIYYIKFRFHFFNKQKNRRYIIVDVCLIAQVVTIIIRRDGLHISAMAFDSEGCRTQN